MKFGIYLHIPHCLQQCTYCDFATLQNYNDTHIVEYLELLKQELRFYSPHIPFDKIDSLYFGGGTPSLIPPPILVRFLEEFKKNFFSFSKDTEITLEINPGTLSEQDILNLLAVGVNRFSVGVQTFDEELLQKTGRKHSVKDSHDLLGFFKKHDVNFTTDILFSLPKQTLKMLDDDLNQFLFYSPPHLSAYCLTIPEKHPLMKGRASDHEQVQMFELIERRLKENDLKRYEISNYSLEGRESRHNQIYWQDHPYLGVGMSAHSYFPRNCLEMEDSQTKESQIEESQASRIEKLQLEASQTEMSQTEETHWGLRFSNSSQFKTYQNWVHSLPKKTQPLRAPNPLCTSNPSPPLQSRPARTPNRSHLVRSHLIQSHRPERLVEKLSLNEFLTDYCHTHLRMMSGLSQSQLKEKYSPEALPLVHSRLNQLCDKGWLSKTPHSWHLSEKGRLLCNQVFEDLTFLKEDFPTNISHKY